MSEKYSTFAGLLPNLQLPLQANDSVIVLRAGVPYQMAPSSLSFIALPNPGTLYVRSGAAGGNDSNNGKSPTVSGGDGPFLTLAHARDVIFNSDNEGAAFTIDIGAGTFQGAQFSGDLRGNAGGGISGQYLILNGAGATTIITDLLGRAFVLEASNGMTMVLQNMKIQVAANKSGIFAQNPGTVVQLGSGLTFDGLATSSVMVHVEAYALVESAATNNIVIDGAWGFLFTVGATGYLEFDPGGTGTLTFGTTTAITQTGFFVDVMGTCFIGSGWSFPNSAGVTGRPYFVGRNAVIDNESGNALPGDVPGVVEGGGRYFPSPIPIVAADTGLGTNGVATLETGAGSHGGVILLTTGSGATATQGTVQLTMTEYNLINASSTAPCVASLQSGATQWPATATIQVLDNFASELRFFWATGGAVIQINTTFRIAYVCLGDMT